MKIEDQKHDALVWWTTRDEAREIGHHILADNFVSAVNGETVGISGIPDDLKATILARAAQTAEPQVHTRLVFGASKSEIVWNENNPVSNEAIKRSGIMFPRSYAPMISDFDTGFCTDIALDRVDIDEIAAEVQAEAFRKLNADYGPESLKILEDLEPARKRSNVVITDEPDDGDDDRQRHFEWPDADDWVSGDQSTTPARGPKF